jgi:hypothetical protein
MAPLTDGGMRAKLGEISLAHQGILFLDGRYMVGALSFSLILKIRPHAHPLPPPGSPGPGLDARRAWCSRLSR